MYRRGAGISERYKCFVQTNTTLYKLLNTYLYCYDVQQLGSSALLWATQHGQEATTRKSLQEGAHIQTVFKSNRTPLALAAESGHEIVVKLLLATDGVDPNCKDLFERTPLSLATPLSWAAVYGREAVVKLLLAKEGVNPNSKNSNGRTPLLHAAEKGHKAVVKLLLATESVDPDCKDSLGWTPLASAAQYGHEVVVKLLLATKNVDPDSNNYLKRTPHSLAAQSGHEGVVELLLATDGTPLSRAAENGREGVVKLLLAKDGVDPNCKDLFGRTPQSLAIRKGHKTVLKLLQMYGIPGRNITKH
ncbi:hypothetical protein N7501_009700 [Penicillium viridicatum]|nr:hypothetical protein N7501_009700 [Penicillium viridicatum]